MINPDDDKPVDSTSFVICECKANQRVARQQGEVLVELVEKFLDEITEDDIEKLWCTG